MKRILLMMSILAGSMMLFACGQTESEETTQEDETASYESIEYTEGLEEDTTSEDGPQNEGTIEDVETKETTAEEVTEGETENPGDTGAEETEETASPI